MSLLNSAVWRAQKSFLLAVAALFVLGTSAPSAFAVVANPNPYQENQPDGTVISLRIRGDEHFSWAEDLDGYTVVRNRGWFEYARVNPQGHLVPTGWKVGLDNPRARGLSRGLLPSASQRAASAKTSPSGSTPSLVSVAPSGTLRNLVVLIQFRNHVGRPVPTAADVDTLMNAPGGDPVLAPTGSLRDLYLQNSYGQLELNSDVSSWVTVSESEQYYANGVSGDSTLWEALAEALDVIDASVDFSQYDANNDGYIDSIAFLHSGYGAEWGATDEDGTPSGDRIWSHKWAMKPEWVSAEGVRVASYHISPALWGTSGSQIGRVGVIAHETGHFLGLPDLYDTDGGGAGIGSYGLMANSWGFDGSQRCPPQLSPWSKLQLGWINPVDISQSGQYSIGSAAAGDEYYVITDGFPSNEYLIIENRQRATLDCSLPQGGLAIWHIDDEAGFNSEGYPGGRWPKDGKHYRVALAQADGNFQLEKGMNRGDAGDVHHAAAVDAMAPGPDGHPNTDAYQKGRIIATGHTISNISASGPVMTFCLNGCAGDGPSQPPGTLSAPSNLVVSVSGSARSRIGSNTVTLSWTDNAQDPDNEDLFIIERCLESGKGGNIRCDFSQHATVGRDITVFSEAESSGTYRYRVKGWRAANEDTAYSNEVRL